MYRDVILINPPMLEIKEDFEHLGLAYIAANLRKNNLSTEIIDLHLNRWGFHRCIEELEKYDFKLIGISIPFQTHRNEAVALIDHIKDKYQSVHLSVGGIYPTFAYQELMNFCQQIDSVVIGEGEETFVELAKRIISNAEINTVKGLVYRDGNKIKKTEVRPLIKKLDTIPFPVRDSLSKVYKKNKYAAMITSRGCYGQCSFCSVVPFYSKFGPKVRLRSVENVLEEIEYLYNDYNVRNFMFNDANYTSSRVRAEEIAREIIKRNLKIHYSIECRANDIERDFFQLLKESGLHRVFIGIESGSETMLERLQKGVTVEENFEALKILGELNLYISMGFIMFDDRSTVNEVNESLGFLKKARELIPDGYLKKAMYTNTKLLPLAGTDFEQYLKEKGNYHVDLDYRIIDNGANFLYNLVNKISRINNFFRKPGKYEKNWESRWLYKEL